MASVTLRAIASGKNHTQTVDEANDAVALSTIERTGSGGAGALWTDAVTTTITIGGGASQTTVTIGRASQIIDVLGTLRVAEAIVGTVDGTGVVIGAVPTVQDTGSTIQLLSVTTTQRDFLAPVDGVDGMMVYNTVTNTIEGRISGSWVDLGAGAGGGVSLAATLAIGAVTGGLDLQVSTGDSILGVDELTLVSTTTGAASLDSGTTGDVNVATGTGIKAVNLGTGGTGAKTVTVGSTASGSTVLIQGTSVTVSTSNDISLTSSANMVIIRGGEIAANAVLIEAVNAGGGVTIGAGTLGITIGNDADVMPVNLGTGPTGAKTVTVGSTASTSSTTINSGTGAINIGTGAQARTITIGELTTVTEVQIDALLVDINAGATGMTLDSAAGIALEAATASSFNVTAGALTLSTTTSGDLTLSTTTAGSILLSGAAAIDVQAATALTIDSSGGAISIGGDANAQAVNLGTGAAARPVTVGSTNSTSSLTLQAGTGVFNLTQAGGDAITIGQVGGASTGSTLGLVNMTTSERDANLTAVAGMLIWNTTTATVQRHNGTSWADIGGATAVFGQFTDTTSQKPGDTNPLVITFDTDDENEGITHDRPEDFKTGAGVFTFLVQPQVERTSGGASMAFHCWARMGRRDGAVTAVSVANPSVITAVDHRMVTGQTVTLSNLSTTPDINGAHVVTVTGADTFTIPVNVTAVADGVGDWTRQLDVNDDIVRTNVELVLKAAGESDVIPLGYVTRMVADDVVQFYQSVTVSSVGGGLVAKTPSGEPGIPSVILSITKGPG